MAAPIAAALCLVFLVVLIAWLANYDEDEYSDSEAEEIQRWLENGEQ